MLYNIICFWLNNTEKICDEAVNICFLAFIHILDWYKTKEMCDRAISKDLAILVDSPDR